MDIAAEPAREKEVQTTLRLNEGLHWELKGLAVRNRRSMNNELICLIERGLAAQTKTAPEHAA